ncbi:MAG: DUF4139 domain-containing protein [Leptolyngbya sp.]|nr:DUF4139 domain-containing protein [Candidatus Melainabacteria bacterium]
MAKVHVGVCLALACSLILSPTTSFAQNSKVSESKGIALTIYNQNFGLVKDSRILELTNGINYVTCEDVAAKIDPTSVSFTSLTAPNQVVVREQNYKYDLIDPTTILNKSVGKTARFKQYVGSQVVDLTGVLLNGPSATVGSTDGGSSEIALGLVLKTPAGIILNPEGQVELAELPAGLVSKPCLDWKLETDKPGAHDVEIAYQTSDINWKCDYVAVTNANDTNCDLTSWVTLDNKSGGTYKEAALKLIAGDVHKVQDVAAPQQMMEMAMDSAAPAAPPPPQFTEQSFAEYHMYTLAGKTDVNNNETKQLSLFNASDVPVKKQFIMESEDARTFGGDIDESGKQKKKIQIKLEMLNKEDNHLGMPMPKGKVRVYKKDADGALQFVGEDEIDHTPRDEKIRIYIGDAFDLVGERRQTINEQPNNHLQRMSYEITLRNHKKEAAKIQVIEHCYGDWKVVATSIPHTKKDSHTFEFAADVPANGEVKITYTIEVKM